MPRKRAKRDSDTEEDFTPLRRSARGLQPRKRFDGMLDLAKISNAELAGRKTRRILRVASVKNHKDSISGSEASGSDMEPEGGRRHSTRKRKQAARPSGCVDLATVSTRIIPYDRPKAKKRRKSEIRRIAVPDTDSPEEDEEHLSMHNPTPSKMTRVPLKEMSTNFTGFGKYAAPASNSSSSDSGSEFHSPNKSASSSSLHSSIKSNSKMRPQVYVQIPRSNIRETNERDLAYSQRISQPTSTSQNSTNMGFPTGSPLTDLRNIAAPAVSYTELAQDDDHQESALTDLRDIETPAFPYTQLNQDDGHQESALTDLHDVETPAFPYTQVDMDDAHQEPALTDLHDVETPAFPYTQFSQDHNHQGPTLTVLGNVETLVLPTTQRTQEKDALQDSVLTDTRDMDTPEFPCAQPLEGENQKNDMSITTTNHLANLQRQSRISLSLHDGSTSSSSDVGETPFFQVEANIIDHWAQSTRLATQIITVSQPSVSQFETLPEDGPQAPPEDTGIENHKSQDAEEQPDSLMPGVPLVLEEDTANDKSDPILPGSWPGPQVQVGSPHSCLKKQEGEEISTKLSDERTKEKRASSPSSGLSVAGKNLNNQSLSAFQSVSDSLLGESSLPPVSPTHSSYYPSESMGDTDMRNILATLVSRPIDDLDYDSPTEGSSSEPS